MRSVFTNTYCKTTKICNYNKACPRKFSSFMTTYRRAIFKKKKKSKQFKIHIKKITALYVIVQLKVHFDLQLLKTIEMI